MSISIPSVISLLIPVVSFFSFLFVTGASGMTKEVSRVIWYISSILSISFPIYAKYYRKKHNCFGRRLEIAALCIAFWTFQMLLMYTLGTNDYINLAITIVFCVVYSKTSNNIAPMNEEQQLRSKAAVRSFFICCGAVLVYWVLILVGPALVLLLNNIGYYVTGGGWGPNSIMYKILEFFSQPISCFLAYGAAMSVSKGEHKICVLTNCIVAACMCGLLIFTSATSMLSATMAVSAVCCIVTAVMVSKEISSKSSEQVA